VEAWSVVEDDGWSRGSGRLRSRRWRRRWISDEKQAVEE
jgi:hypothetical protein